MSLSLEINFCIALVCNTISPTLVGYPEPIPSIFIVSISFFAIFAINLLGKPKKNRNVSVQQAIANLSQTYNLSIAAHDDIKNKWMGGNN